MNESIALSNTRQATHDEISQKARELWENYGRPAGRDEEIWLEAERALRSPASDPGAQPTTDNSPAPARSNQRPVSGATATPKMPGGRGRQRAPR